MPATEHSISFGPYSAVITERSGALRELRHAGRDLVVSFGAEGPIPDYRGVVCAPWPNRIADGRYSHGGRNFRAAVNEPQRHTALHGLALDARWSTVARTDSSVTLNCRIDSGPAYPGRLEIVASYELREDGLHCTVAATNTGDLDAPYGVCPHPYLVAGTATLDEWTLELPAGEFLEVTPDRLLPLQLESVVGHTFDFRAERLLGGIRIDHAFTGLSRTQDGLAAVRVFDPSGTGVELEWDQACAWVQVHTGDKPIGPDRLGLAVEPMTCPPDAFNSGTDLVELAPGATHEAVWTIRALSR